MERRSLCVDLLTWLRGKKEGVGALSLSVFSFFLSRLSLHAQCHIPIPYSSKLIRDNACLMETFPQNTPSSPLFLSLPLSRLPSVSLSFSSSPTQFPSPKKDST